MTMKQNGPGNCCCGAPEPVDCLNQFAPYSENWDNPDPNSTAFCWDYTDHAIDPGTPGMQINISSGTANANRGLVGPSDPLGANIRLPGLTPDAPPGLQVGEVIAAEWTVNIEPATYLPTGEARTPTLALTPQINRPGEPSPVSTGTFGGMSIRVQQPLGFDPRLLLYTQDGLGSVTATIDPYNGPQSPLGHRMECEVQSIIDANFCYSVIRYYVNGGLLYTYDPGVGSGLGRLYRFVDAAYINVGPVSDTSLTVITGMRLNNFNLTYS